MKQKTIKKEFTISGVGLHTGSKTQLTFKATDENEGINFVRTDLSNQPVIKAEPASIHLEQGLPRCTSIGEGEAIIHTVEHLMSVLCGLGISNLTVEIDGNEIPGLDGSGLDFLKVIKNSGIVEQKAEVDTFYIKEPIAINENDSCLYIVPDDDLKISYTLDYNYSVLKSQFFSCTMSEKVFEQEIASCRTFCLESEAKELQKSGLGKGATYENTLVVGDNGVIDNKARFEDEFARHKVLDFIGDLYLLGVPICGHVFAVKSGHLLNIQLLKKIQKQREKYKRTDSAVTYDFANQKEIDIDGIMSILPHRYPFLLVDRVIEIEKGKKAVGIKNVTINDNFFQGHFPSRPVMPGVLMIEAMAQTGGVVVLTNEAHHGKVAFFLSADNVKFRKTVIPGDQLFMEVEVVRDRSKTAQIHAQAKVKGEIVAEADMVFSFTDASYLNE